VSYHFFVSSACEYYYCFSSPDSATINWLVIILFLCFLIISFHLYIIFLAKVFMPIATASL
jgi:hypothetical protein